ncbi:hypothetical protein CNMCM5623_000864 [Aspergillus felis]|uniref:Major facilitator superfamily (MFS) profile domain-containing protein n=1 Tax=Aspergillus felis TaxID=1287682 RepID=A0A8H6Q730_9EURO|nr:hypothetical protein CNMCM5623_000864 [Aspergillus felis]
MSVLPPARNDLSEKERASAIVTRQAQPPPDAWSPTRQNYIAIWSLSIISMVVGLDTTILIPALPTIAEDLNATAIQAFWCATSYVLSCTVCQLFIASLSHIFGRCELLLISELLFAAGTAIVCSAHGIAQLLVGRSIQGIGGGGIVALVQVVFTDIIPLRHRPKYLGYLQVASALGTISGPLVGGAVSQYSTWRWIFYINFPFCLGGLITLPLGLKFQQFETSFVSRLLLIDWFGGFLFTASATSFLMALSWGGVQFPWGSFHTLVPLIVGLVGVGVALVWEAYGTKEPFLKLSVFNSWSAAAAQICSFAQGFLLLGQLYYIPFYFEGVKGMSPILTGVALIPRTFTNIPIATITGIMITKLGRFRWAVWSGWILSTIGSGLLILFDVHTPTAAWVIILLVNGLGQGLLLASLNVAVLAIAAGKNPGFAVATYTFTRFLGMSFGIAVGGTIFQNALSQYLAHQGIDTAIAQNAEAYIIELSSEAVSADYKAKVVYAYAQAFRCVFIALAAVSAIATALGFCIASFPLGKKTPSVPVSVPAPPPEGGPEKTQAEV